MDEKVSQLLTSLYQAKKAEAIAKAERVSLEAKIVNLYKDRLKPEGTTNVDGIKFVTKFNRKWDDNKLTEISQKIKPEFWPFSVSYNESRSESKSLQSMAPELWDSISAALTLTPAKTSISIIEEG